ncbi:MAG: hypothetical protein JXR34_04465 [Bacteroidales bacterium]|nr:hypothetical protein [Bacteroidales bacterium]
MTKFIGIIAIVAFLVSTKSLYSQSEGGTLHGSFQVDAQLYQEDTIIGATIPDEKMGVNSFLDLIYTYKNFEAGVRYEAFMPPLQGFDPRYKGHGIPYRYAKYTNKQFELTAGNFYEQFGSGMILRAYQEWNLGFDNSIDGIRVKANFPGIRITGLVGKQRSFWGKGDGLVRGIDAEIHLNQAFKRFNDKKTQVFVGGNFVSRYQQDLDPIYILPANVGAYSGRLNIYRGNWVLLTEAGYKINDPNATNNMIYKDGHAVLLTLSYSKKGFGASLQAKRVDNMDFRSDRTATGFNLPINYIPAMTAQHAYTMPAYYPYATQANGEMGLQATIQYKVKKKSVLGGKTGMGLELNYSISQGLQKNQINDSTTIGMAASDGYTSPFFEIGKEKYYHDFNFKITKKINTKWNLILSYYNIFYNMNVIEGHEEPNVLAQTGVADVWWKFKKYQSLHFDVEATFAEEDWGNWFLGMVEYNYKSFFAAVIDQYNYGNPVETMQIHYLSVSSGYTWNTTRLALTYGKQSNGILCVGGVCREVPATNGFSISLTSSF